MKSTSTQVVFCALEHYPDENPPHYASTEASGMDLRSAEDVILAPLERKLIACGFCMQMPSGLEAQVRPRSGLALKHGLTVLNSPGTIDSDYRGEIKVILINLGAENYEIKRGERIAQMVFAPVVQVSWTQADKLNESSRGAGGFGHTGLK